MKRSRFDFRIHDGVICIVDESGVVSVTNDIENVVTDLVKDRIIDGKKPIVYQDSRGRWDGISLNSDLEFKNFVLFGASSRDQAIAKIKEIQGALQ